MKKLDITEYNLTAPVTKPLTAAVLSDLHGEEHGYILDAVRKYSPDLILIPGDVTHSHISTPESCFAFFKDCVAMAPTFMSLGNHENNSYKYVIKKAAEAGVTVLEDDSTEFCGITIGGLSSGYLDKNVSRVQGHWQKTPEPNLGWLRQFAAKDGYKLLLNHHPEYYPEYIRELSVDLILSGHAHGGQWRIFGHPFFAPGQLFFPKYAQGIHDGRLIVSRGLANNAPVPRFGNNREVIILHFSK